MILDLLTIEHTPNPEMLRHPACEVSFPLSASIKDLIVNMQETLLHINGVGLAAPQVNEPLRIIAIHISEAAAQRRLDADEPVPMTFWFNPSYEPVFPLQMRDDWEGCFSVERIMGKVPRYTTIRFRAQNITGEWVDQMMSGFYARVLQHEIDHINGVLITDRLGQESVQGHPDIMMPIRMKELESQGLL